MNLSGKYLTIVKLAELEAREITSSALKYMVFLTTAANNFKYSFRDQLLIHAQKPEATACAEISFWNSRGYWVNRGAKGIALLVDTDAPYKLRHIYDVSDTNNRDGRTVPIWRMQARYEDAVVESLENSFGAIEHKTSFPDCLIQTANSIVEDNFADYLSDLTSVKDGSLLEELDEQNTEVWLKTTLKNSVAFMLLTRCGYDAENFFTAEDFSHVYDFNTPETISVLGSAASDISEMALREIAATVLSLQREETRNRTFEPSGKVQYDSTNRTNFERSIEHGYNIQNTGRLPDTELGRAGYSSTRKIWDAAAQLPPQAQERDLHRDAAVREAGQSPEGDRPEGIGDAGAPDLGAGEVGGRDGEPESVGSDEMGGIDEQHPPESGGDRDEGADLQLSSMLPTVEEQKKIIAEAEVEKTSAFAISQEDIDAILLRGGIVSGGKFRIYEQFLKKESSAENVQFLKKEYGVGGAYPAVSSRNLDEWHDSKGIRISRGRISEPDAEITLSWGKAAKRIAELVDADRFLSPAEKERYPAYRREREQREERGKISEEFRSIISDYKDYVAQIGGQDKTIDRWHLVSCADSFITGEKKMYSRTNEGDFILPIMRDTMQTIIAENTHLTERCKTVLTALNSDIARPFEPTYDELNLPTEPPKEYRFSLGDKVYLGTREYELLAFNEQSVRLYDSTFPLVNKELPRDEFDRMLAENPLNDHLLQVVEESAATHETTEQLEPEDVTPDKRFFVVDLDRGSRKAYGIWDDAANGIYVDDEGVSEEFDSKWQADAYAEQLNAALLEPNNPDLETAQRFINDYCMKEFEQEADFSDLHHVDLAFSTTSDSRHDIEVSANLIYCYIAYEVDRKVVAMLQCSNLQELNEHLAKLDFDEMIAFAEEQYNQQEQNHQPQQGQEPTEKEQEQLTPPPASKPRSKASNFVLHPEIPNSQRQNYHITDDALGVGTSGERYSRNVAAIRLLKRLENENRLATSDEQEVLSKYVGWGGLADCFDERHSKYAELKSLLTEDEYDSARASTLNAHFTSPTVIKAIYEAVGNMGFKIGNVLEPSCGVGNFFGLLPENMAESRLYGVELDSITGRIAQQLYQKNSVAVQGFEDTSLPDSFFDLAVGNVPFGNYKVNDKNYNRLGFSIHNYFLAKTMDKLRPGGIAAFVTSRYTMDSKSPAARKYLAERAELIGAVRLPNNAFKANAGTDVVSDILFFKKKERPTVEEPEWIHLAETEDGFSINSYFVEHPEMVLGTPTSESTQYGRQDYTVAPIEGAELSDQIHEAIQNIRAEYTEYEIDDPESVENRSIPADPGVRNFSFTVVDGDIYYRENSVMNPVEMSVTAESRIKGMIAIRDCVRKLIESQIEDYPDEYIRDEQVKLNDLYDEFEKKYGRINSRSNKSAFASDSSYFLLSSLEVLDDEGNFVRKADMFTKRTIKQKVVVTSVDTASEALAVSLAEKAKVDMPYMMELTGKTEQEIYADLTGVIFLNPMHGYGSSAEEKYLTADEYLSGNVREKLGWARRSAELNPEDYASNVQALEQVQPVDLTASEISVRLGASWIPPEVIRQFMFELLDTPYYAQWKIQVHYSKYTCEWNIESKSYDKTNIKANSVYGTGRINGYKIVEETLNLRDVRIFDYIVEDGKRTPVLNKKETAIAQGKQELIKQAFQNWIWADPERREKLCKLYNEKFNSIRPREYDGSHLNFVGINPEIALRPHQVNAIAHILYGGNTLLAHTVGAGKTYEMVAAAQESKRLGLCQKSLFVVPNHLTEQWAAEYLQLYPSANILVATKKDFETKNRKKFCSRIATGSYDAIIIGHSQFEKIPMSIERQRYILVQQMEEIVDGIQELKSNHGDRFSVKQLERTKKSIKAKLEKLNDQSRKDDVVTFEELGVDRLFIDEAHYYKNLAAFSKMRNVGGISQTEAQKSSDLYMKCRYLDELTGGRGVVFATGTPISNTMVEMYTMQKYLQYGLLAENGLLHFDAWASTFGETVTAIELAPEGTGYRSKTRFAKFYNLPELMAMFKEVADIQTADMLNLPVPKANYHHVVLKPSEHQKEMVADLFTRAERVRNKMVDSKEDNMLLITNDGRKLALDQRLINPLLPDSETSKVSACANNIFEIWQRTAEQCSTQMAFCDLSTPKGNGDFNVYDDLRDKLIAKGIPAEEIAYIHSAKTEAHKKELFGKVRSGQVRVLLGSTQKMGAGTNVQSKLIALHHLDCPWRPADLQQREGRIIRQGNENPEVEIYTYVTENTFDSYLYQLVESKQKFIGQIMTSKSPVRSAEDVDETALSYAEIKALCAGDPNIKEKMDLDIDVQRLKLLKANHLSQKYALEDQIIKEFPQKIATYEQLIEGYKADMAQLAVNTQPNEDGFSPMEIEGTLYNDKKAAGSAILAACKAMTSPNPVPLGQYRGFDMELSFDSFGKKYILALKGALHHSTELGTDIFGNITRVDNLLAAFSESLKKYECLLENTHTQLTSAKEQIDKPFPQEEELKTKSARLDELNILLNLDKRENEIVDGERDEEVTPVRKSPDWER